MVRLSHLQLGRSGKAQAKGVKMIPLRWAWFLLAVLALLGWAHMNRYRHISFEAAWVDMKDSDDRQLEFREAVWDQWRQQACMLVRGAKTKAKGSREYSRRICW